MLDWWDGPRTLKNERKTIKQPSSEAKPSKEDPQDISKFKIEEVITAFNPFLQNFLREIIFPLHTSIFYLCAVLYSVQNDPRCICLLQPCKNLWKVILLNPFL